MMEKRTHMLVAMILLSLATGLLAGVVGAVVSENYLNDYAASLQQAGERTLELSAQKPRDLPGTFEEAVDNAHATLSPALVRFYALPNDALLPGEESGFGVIVTSDGWVATTQSAMNNDVGLHVAYVGDQAYQIARTFFDPLTDVVMVDLEATGLPVVPFGASDQVEGGTLAFAATSQTAIFPTAVVDAKHWIGKTSALPAEQFTTDFLLADLFPKSGVPIVNSAGELIAVDSVPLHHVLSFIKSVIRSAEVDRVPFGASVIDLHLVKTSDALARGFTRGDYVTAVTPGSPAGVAGLVRGDIITRFGDVTLNGHSTLAELLTSYHLGDSVQITVDRGGEEREITVVLGSQK